MRYIGSKASTLAALADLIGARIPAGDLCDPFGGVGTFGAHFRGLGYRVHTGDLLSFAHDFQVVRVASAGVPGFAGVPEACGAGGIVQYLNGLPGEDGWLTREFAIERRFLSVDNARRGDAVHRTVLAWAAAGHVTAAERSWLMAGLISSLDRVANTAGTYYACLKVLGRRALRPFEFRPVSVPDGPAGTAVVSDAADLAASRPWDVLYLDPPYTARRYGGYYHLPELLSRGVEPCPRGASGITALPHVPSPYYTKQSLSALVSLLERSRFRLLVMHYSDTGLMDPDALVGALRRFGAVTTALLPALGYRTTPGARGVVHRVLLVES